MMVLTAFTKGGGLAAHLLRRDTNKEVCKHPPKAAVSARSDQAA